MKQVKILAVAAPEYGLRADSVVGCEYINRMATMTPDPENRERAAAMPVDAVVLFSARLTEDECAFMENLYMTRGKIAFLLVCETADAEVYIRAMRCGITKVFTFSVPEEEICRGIAEEVAKVCSRSETSGVREYDSTVLSIFSTKGGTGKTTIAVNLAVALAGCGKRVALVDLDLQFGDVGIFMNIPHCDTISDLAGEKVLNPSVINGCLYQHRTGVSVLCAPSSPEQAEIVHTEHLDKIITVLRAEFDYVICDLSPILDDTTLFALDRSDTVYFITNPEIPALKNTRTCMGIIRALNCADKIRLVLNRDGDPFIGRKDVESALDMEPVLYVPVDTKSASAAINRGIPVIESYPHSKITKAIVEFAEREVSSGKEKAKSHLFGRKG